MLVYDIQHTPDGDIELTQTGLINKIIHTCIVILTADATGPQREHSWNHRSLIGMLNYLASSNRPDLTFAAQQCACFPTAPRRSHELALRHIVRYLKATSTKGYIFWLTFSQNLDFYVDVDFVLRMHIFWTLCCQIILCIACHMHISFVFPAFALCIGLSTIKFLFISQIKSLLWI